MEAIASAKYLRGSAQKARLVVDMIRGKDVNQALAILRFSNKRAVDCDREVHAFGDRQCERSGRESKRLDRPGRSLGEDRVRRSRTDQEPASRASRSAGPGLSRAATLLSRDDSVSNDERPEPKAKRSGDGKAGSEAGEAGGKQRPETRRSGGRAASEAGGAEGGGC